MPQISHSPVTARSARIFHTKIIIIYLSIVHHIKTSSAPRVENNKAQTMHINASPRGPRGPRRAALASPAPHGSPPLRRFIAFVNKIANFGFPEYVDIAQQNFTFDNIHRESSITTVMVTYKLTRDQADKCAFCKRERQIFAAVLGQKNANGELPIV